MKRLAFVLAAAVLGTGCHSTRTAPAVGSVNLYWDFDRTAPAQAGGFITYDAYPGGTVSGRCTQSAVDFVTVDAPGAAVSVSCVYAGVQGVGVDGVDAGTQPFRVRGWRHVSGTDVVVYDSTFNLSVPVASVQDHIVHVPGVAATLDVFGDLAYGASPGTLYPDCASAGSPNLYVAIRDAFGTLIDDNTAGCSDPLPAPAFSALLDLDDYQVRVQGLQLGTNALVFDSCSASWPHFGTQTAAGGLTLVARTNPVPTGP